MDTRSSTKRLGETKGKVRDSAYIQSVYTGDGQHCTGKPGRGERTLPWKNPRRSGAECGKKEGGRHYPETSIVWGTKSRGGKDHNLVLETKMGPIHGESGGENGGLKKGRDGKKGGRGKIRN